MNIEEVREYALTLPGAREDMPYGPDWLIFRIEGEDIPAYMAGVAGADMCGEVGT